MYFIQICPNRKSPNQGPLELLFWFLLNVVRNKELKLFYDFFYKQALTDDASHQKGWSFVFMIVYQDLPDSIAPRNWLFVNDIDELRQKSKQDLDKSSVFWSLKRNS